MLIAVDVDETIIKFIPYFLKWHNLTYGTSVKPTDLNNFDMGEKLGCPNGNMWTGFLNFMILK